MHCGKGTTGMIERLLQSVAPVRANIREANNPQGHWVETYLDLSARHVVASTLGVGLYVDPTIVGTLADPASIQTAALMIVFGNGQASMDQCATSLLRWNGRLPDEDREHDVGDLKKEIKNKNIKLNQRQQDWFQKVISDKGEKFIEFRHAITHRHIRQDATVGGSSRQTISPDPGSSGHGEAAKVLHDRALFVEERWREFWHAFF